MMTLEHSLISTWHLPLFSALLILLRASARTFMLVHSLSPSSRVFLDSSLLSAIRVVSSAFLRLLIFLPAVLIQVCESSSLAFSLTYSAYKLNKQGGNRQPWRTPFPVLNQFVVPCLVLTVASFPAYRFLRRQVTWSDIHSHLFKNFPVFCGLHSQKL